MFLMNPIVSLVPTYPFLFLNISDHYSTLCLIYISVQIFKIQNILLWSFTK